MSDALIRYLRRRGAGLAQAQDIAQDVALKVLVRDVSFTSAQDLLRWCFPVARNALVDAQRASARLVAVPDATDALPDGINRADVFDTHRVVESRLRLQHVLSGIRQLSRADQDALAPLLDDDGVPEPTDRRESTRLAVRRHRARSRLVALVGPAAAALGWVLGARPARTSTRLVPTAAVASLSIAALSAVAVPGLGDAEVRPSLAPMVTASVERPSQVTRPAATRIDRTAPAARVEADELAPTPVQPAARVEVPATDVAVRTGARSRTGRALVCVGGIPGGTRCVDRPAELPKAQPGDPLPGAGR